MAQQLTRTWFTCNGGDGDDDRTDVGDDDDDEKIYINKK
jgi:hypothetical protein